MILRFGVIAMCAGAAAFAIAGESVAGAITLTAAGVWSLWLTRS